MQIFGLILKVSVVALVFATGLNATPRDIGWLWHRPALLLKSLLAMYVVVPVVAVLMVQMLDLPRGTEMAIVILAVCAGAPLLPRKLIKFGGDPSYVLSLVVATSALAIVIVPAWLYLIGALFSTDLTVPPAEVARLLAKTFLLPFAAGVAISALLPKIAARASGLLLGLAGIALLGCSIVLLVVLRREILAVGVGSFLAFGAFAVVGLAAGHLLGGPDASHRTSLAVSCTTRHVGLALLIAGQSPGRRVLALVLAYLLATVLVSIPYVKWRQSVRAGSVSNRGTRTPLERS